MSSSNQLILTPDILPDERRNFGSLPAGQHRMFTVMGCHKA